ncbi:MAG: NTP transferase domain-containing protein [Planctomycetes bacterium]|nr:NTP transferase domain-containing protein [Planctomycetota bacterium]
MSPTPPIAIVLAAGRGTRMGTDLPKVLCEAAGKPLVTWVLEALAAAGIEERIVVVGHRAADVERALAGVPGVSFALQTALRGTGDAVAAAVPHLRRAGGGPARPVVIVCGDSPMLRPASIAHLLGEFAARSAACLLGTTIAADPTGLGRIVRDDAGRFEAIVEERDATPQQRLIREVNMSTYVFAAGALVDAVGRLDNGNAAGEYYLTDCPRLLASDGLVVDAVACLDQSESLSVNTPAQLAAVAAALAARPTGDEQGQARHAG